MKRTLTGLVAASIIMGSAVPAAFAAKSVSHWFKMTIEVNGSTISSPYGIAQSDGSNTTTYIPMFYVNQALTKVGYKVTWNGAMGAWALTTSNSRLDFSTISMGSGNTSITVNQKSIKKINTIIEHDPAGGIETAYIPIYYVAPLFQAMGISAAWDGNSHKWSINNTTSNNSSGNGSSNNNSGSADTLTPPTIQLSKSNGSTNIAVQNAASLAKLTLCSADNTEIIATSANANGTATFYNVGTGSYYVIETVNGQESGKSNVVTVSANTTVSTPTIFSSESNGVWYIGVNNAASSSTVTLYTTNGTKIASTTSNQYGYATFNNIGSGNYYVVEAANGQNYQSNAISVNTTNDGALSAPSIASDQSNGLGTITTSNVTPGATVTLYSSDGSIYATTTANTSGIATFNQVVNGTYDAIQTWNGQQSSTSNHVTINIISNALTTPSILVNVTNGLGTISVSNVMANATVTVYTASGTVYTATTANSSGYATFNNMTAGSYYVVQTWNGQQSAASNAVTINTNSGTLTTPSILSSVINGVGSISVNNLASGATITLYASNGTAYASTTANSSGTAAFNNVGNGTYYVVQVWNGQQSAISNSVSINVSSGTLSTPTISVNVVNGLGTISVTNTASSAAVILYRSNGNAYTTVTANSSGYATFTNIGNGTYYVVQTWNGQQSAASNSVTI